MGQGIREDFKNIIAKDSCPIPIYHKYIKNIFPIYYIPPSLYPSSFVSISSNIIISYDIVCFLFPTPRTNEFWTKLSLNAVQFSEGGAQS